jgi:hypothetical protein
MVVIPIPAPSMVHSLVLVKVPLEFVPPVLHSSPSPLYVEAWKEDLMHDGVLGFWVEFN